MLLYFADLLLCPRRNTRQHPLGASAKFLILSIHVCIGVSSNILSAMFSPPLPPCLFHSITREIILTFGSQDSDLSWDKRRVGAASPNLFGRGFDHEAPSNVGNNMILPYMTWSYPRWHDLTRHDIISLYMRWPYPRWHNPTLHDTKGAHGME